MIRDLEMWTKFQYVRRRFLADGSGISVLCEWVVRRLRGAQGYGVEKRQRIY